MQCKKSSTDHSTSINRKQSTFSSLSTPRKPPKQEFIEKMKSTANYSNTRQLMSDVNDTVLYSLRNSFLFSKNEESTIFYKFDTNSIPAPKVCEMLKIHRNPHVKLFYESSPIPLPSWFRKRGTAC